MPTTTTVPAPAPGAIDEAVRTFSAASQNGAAYAQEALATTRAYLSDVLAVNPSVIEGWQTDLQALVKAGFGCDQSIRARIEEVGGTAEIWSEAGRGTRVRVWVPL